MRNFSTVECPVFVFRGLPCSLENRSRYQTPLFLGLADLTLSEWRLIRNMVYCCCPELQPPQPLFPAVEYGELTRGYCLFLSLTDPNLLFPPSEEVQIAPAHSQEQNLGCVSQGIPVSYRCSGCSSKTQGMRNNNRTFRVANHSL